MNLLANAKSINDRGTLANVKNIFIMRSVKPKVSAAFNHDEDMLHAITKMLVVLVAMVLLHLDDPKKESKAKDDVLLVELAETAEAITNFFWHQTSMTDIMSSIEADVPESNVFCKCQGVIGNFC